MPMVYEDLQSLESKKKNPGVRNGLPAPQVFLQDLCSGSRPLLLSLGLSLLLLIGICVIGAKNSKTQRELETLRATFSNFSSNITAEVQELRTLGGSLQEKTTSLKASVENLGQQLQAASSLKEKVVSLESKMEKEQQELKSDYSDMVLRIQELVKDLNSLSCQMTELRNNGSQKSCCPVNWLEHEGSCYFFSHTEKSWSEAEKYCRLENAHLVVVGSLEEQGFLMQHTSSVNTWIGLTDQDGPWRWVDGTDYETGFKFWSPEQPDNWSGHGLGGNEDCAHIRYNNQWNDNVCSRLYRWVCEVELYRAS